MAGLVFVDPSSGDQDRRLAAIAPGAGDGAARIAAARKCAKAVDSGALVPGSAIEKSCVRARPGLVPPAFATQAFARWEHGPDLRAKLAETEGADFDTLRWPQDTRTDAPVIVLTATGNFAGEPKEKELRALWNSMHDDIARMSPQGMNCVVSNSTHSMMFSRPDAVVGAVSAMVGAVRGQRPVALDCDRLNGARP